jgi:hypothetical protein
VFLMDLLELGIRARHWAETVIRVNGTELLELVAEEERPFAEAEGHPDLAGAYAGIPASDAFLPSHHLLGRPEPLLSDLVRSGKVSKAALLMCECGESGCWPFCARVEVDADVVRWMEFEQPHRPAWRYEGLGPFVFDRSQYEAALARPSVP